MEQKLHTPEGVRDIYSNECRAKLAVQDKLHQVLHLYVGHKTPDKCCAKIRNTR